MPPVSMSLVCLSPCIRGLSRQFPTHYTNAHRHREPQRPLSWQSIPRQVESVNLLSKRVEEGDRVQLTLVIYRNPNAASHQISIRLFLGPRGTIVNHPC